MEEWTFLPTNWKNLVDRKQLWISKNFVIFGFFHGYPRPYPQGTGDILILNMASRKRFWMQTEKIQDEVKAKMTSTSAFQFSEYDTHSTRPKVQWMFSWAKKNEMRPGTDGIFVKIDIETMYGFPKLGGFSVLKVHAKCFYIIYSIHIRYVTFA